MFDTVLGVNYELELSKEADSRGGAMSFDIDELLAAVQKIQIDEHQVEKLALLLNDHETKFEEESRQRQTDECFLTRAYCL